MIPVPATSASTWSALLRSHMEIAQPTVDRWRGILVTLLVFVSLTYSAFVAILLICYAADVAIDVDRPLLRYCDNIPRAVPPGAVARPWL